MGEADVGTTSKIQPIDRGWMIALGVAILVGLVAISTYALNANDPAAAAGGGILLAGSCLVLGTLLGFLFGIPRSQRQATNADAVVDPTATEVAPSPEYQPNTNLEQISDWLTKILIGVGLTQLSNAPTKIKAAAKFIAPSLGVSPGSEIVAVGIFLYFPTVGFLFGFLWTRLFLAGSLARADLLVVVEQRQQQQQQNDAAALAIVQQYLSSGPGDVTPQRLSTVISKASAPIKVQVFYLAQTLRRLTWKIDKQKMERTIPIFEALVAAAGGKLFHKNYAQLGFALKDKRQPDWASAEQMLTIAIDTRGKKQQFGWPNYEANRAVCRIQLDEAFQAGSESAPEVRDRILQDIKVARSDKEVAAWLDDAPTSAWLKLNKIELSSISKTVNQPS